VTAVEARRAKGESLRAIARDLGVSPALLVKRAKATSPEGALRSKPSRRLTNAIPSDSRSASVITRCFRLRPNRSSFQTGVAHSITTSSNLEGAPSKLRLGGSFYCFGVRRLTKCKTMQIDGWRSFPAKSPNVASTHVSKTARRGARGKLGSVEMKKMSQLRGAAAFIRKQ
jgi:hypothetical protein